MGVLQLQTVWPFPAEYVCELAKDKKERRARDEHGTNNGEVRKAVPDAFQQLANRYDGEPLAPYEIMKALDEVLSL